MHDRELDSATDSWFAGPSPKKEPEDAAEEWGSEEQIIYAVKPASGAVRFDGDWFGQQMSEADYTQAFSDADTQYARMLRALIAQAQ